MVEALTRTCYLDVTRYGLSGSLAVGLAGPREVKKLALASQERPMV